MKTPTNAKWYFSILTDRRGLETRYRVKAVLSTGRKVYDSYYDRTYNSKQKAQSRVKELQREQTRGSNRVEFLQYAKEFILLRSQTKKWGKQHLSQVEKIMNEFADFLKSIKIKYIDEIRESTVETFLMKYNNHKIRSKNIRLVHIRAVLRKAYRDKLIPDDLDLQLVRQKDREKTRPFTPDEMNSILDYIRKHHEWLFLPVLFLSLTGMRRREVCLLKWQYIKENEIIIPANITKASRERQIPISNNIRSLLDTLERSDKDDYVFRNEGGKRLNPDHLTHTFCDIVKKLDFETGYRLHSLRATFITNALAQGADIIALMDIVGHRQLSTTQGYTSPFKESKKAIMELNILGNPKPKNDSFDYGKIVNFQKRI